MPILVSIINNKGGVGKTTGTYNIGYILSEHLGKRVLIVDMDAQTNLTGIILNDTFQHSDKIEKFYNGTNRKANQDGIFSTVYDIFRPIIQLGPNISLTPDRAKQVEISPVHKYKNLFMIPGHLDVSDMDEPITLGIAGVPLYRFIPKSITDIFREIARLNDIDVVLFDCSPSLGGLNQAIIMGSDYFLVPFNADFFSYQAITNLTSKITGWKSKFDSIYPKESNPDFKGSPVFLGAYPQKIRTRKEQNKPKILLEQSYGAWINKIYGKVKILVERLRPLGMVSTNYKLTKACGIRDFVGLGLDVQTSGHPISDLKFPHLHHVSDKKTRSLTGSGLITKKRIASTYCKVVGALFRNLTDADKESMGEEFNRSVNRLSSIYEGVDARSFDDTSQLEPPTPLPISPELSDESWYTDDQIRVLLKHYFKDNNDVTLLDPISGDHLDGQTFRDNLEDFKNQNATQGRSYDQSIVIPVNLAQLHWVLLFIPHSIQQSHITFIYYFDPMGAPPQESMVDLLDSIFPNAMVVNLDQRVQNDGFNCGPWIVEAARSLATGQSLPEPSFNIQRCRLLHREILDQPAVGRRRRRSSSSASESPATPQKKQRTKMTSKSPSSTAPVTTLFTQGAAQSSSQTIPTPPQRHHHVTQEQRTDSNNTPHPTHRK